MPTGVYKRGSTTGISEALGGNKNRYIHGMIDTGTYRSWYNMKSRCNNPKSTSYPLYGARGIEVCNRWHTFVNFLEDMGERPEGTSLDRIDNDGNYESSNCRWATPKEQANNRRTSKEIALS